VGPAVVGITNKAYVRDFFNRVALAERGTGSGVIYDASGLIATNNHVVEGAQEIIVSLSDGRSIKGKVLGADAATDLAVVKIDAANLPVATLGDSSTLQVGEPAIAIGNPLGLEFRGSVTAGVISALNRSIEIGDRKYTLIQTDAAINPGNSGGALVNADGEVVGINSAKIAVSGVEGIGFAIPINTAKPILTALAKQGRVIRPYVGASLVDKEFADRYGFDVDVHGGLLIMKLVQGGPLAAAGIQTGDIITKFAGEKVSKVAELRAKIAEHKVGDKVEITILRNGAEMTKTIVLQEYPKDTQQ
jgi:serine protease Do